MRDGLTSLIPKSKTDVETAKLAVDAGFPKVEPILFELLDWVQDWNWPVTRVLYPFLSKVGLPLLPHIKRILATNDEGWKYWMLELIRDSRDLYLALKDDVNRIAFHPTASEKLEGLNERSKQIIKLFEVAKK